MQSFEVALFDMRQNDILLMADTQFVARIGLGQLGQQFHLVGCRVSGDAADRFQRDGDDGMAARLVLVGVAFQPVAKTGLCIGMVDIGQVFP